MTQEPLERRVRTVEEAITFMAETQRIMADNITLLTQAQIESKQRHDESDQRFNVLLQEIRHLSRRMDNQDEQ
jgi:hypothetical protein